MEFLAELGLFGAKVFFMVFGALVILFTLFILRMKGKEEEPKIKITHLNKKWKGLSQSLKAHILSKKELKRERKEFKKEAKETQTSIKEKKKIYVLNFQGDMQAKIVEQLRDEITALLSIAQKGKDEVVLKLNSPGGTVTGYGLAGSQLLRIKKADLQLTICVDQVAASGGYLMACVADQILSAPFAILGSIGVITSFPNFHKILKKNDVEYYEITAGKFKRTLTPLGEPTSEKEAKHKERIESIHTHFKSWIQENRPSLDLEKVGNGDYWLAKDALKLNLVDKLMTVDEYLYSQHKEADIYEIKIKKPKKKIIEKLMDSAEAVFFSRFIEKQTHKDMFI